MLTVDGRSSTKCSPSGHKMHTSIGTFSSLAEMEREYLSWDKQITEVSTRLNVVEKIL